VTDVTSFTRRIPRTLRDEVERARRALGDPRARVNYGWIRALTGASAERIADAFDDARELVPFEERLRAEHLAAGRPYYAQIRAPLELYALVRLLEPDHVIETGVSSGVSSTHFLLGLRRNRRGTLHSIDLPQRQRSSTLGRNESTVALPPGRLTGWAVPTELRARWDLRLGPSQELLPPLVRELPSVGLFLHDSRHTPSHLRFELATVREKTPPGAVVIADNTVWTGEAFPRFARILGVRVARRGRSDLVGLTIP